MYLLRSAGALPLEFFSALGMISLGVAGAYAMLECIRWLRRNTRSWQWWLVFGLAVLLTVVSVPALGISLLWTEFFFPVG